MEDIRCPRCRGLLVSTFEEREPVRCVNCGNRLSREQLVELCQHNGHPLKTQRAKRSPRQPKQYVG